MAKKYAAVLKKRNGETFYVKDLEAHEAIGTLETNVSGLDDRLQGLEDCMTTNLTASISNATGAVSRWEYDGTAKTKIVQVTAKQEQKLGSTVLSTKTLTGSTAGATFTWGGSGVTQDPNDPTKATVSRTDLGTSARPQVSVSYGGQTKNATGGDATALTVYLPQMIFKSTATKTVTIQDLKGVKSNINTENFTGVTKGESVDLTGTPEELKYYFVASPTALASNTKIYGLDTEALNSGSVISDLSDSNYAWYVRRAFYLPVLRFVSGEDTEMSAELLKYLAVGTVPVDAGVSGPVSGRTIEDVVGTIAVGQGQCICFAVKKDAAVDLGKFKEGGFTFELTKIGTYTDSENTDIAYDVYRSGALTAGNKTVEY